MNEFNKKSYFPITSRNRKKFKYFVLNSKKLHCLSFMIGYDKNIARCSKCSSHVGLETMISLRYAVGKS